MATPARVMPVFDTLRTEILTGALLPGDAVNEVAIARRLGVSHTPVREALMELIGQGFVETAPNRRRYVAHYSPRRAVEIVQLQGLTYQYALRRVADVATTADVARLAERFRGVAVALRSGDTVVADRATAGLVAEICAVSGDRAVATTLPAVSQRGFALILLPPEAWALWHGWADDLCRMADGLQRGKTAQVADDYLATEIRLADTISRWWPQPPHWPDDHGVGRSRAGVVAERIRRDLFSGDLDVDRSIGEAELARRYGVSTTPVREALRLLSSHGLIVTEPNGRRRVAPADEAGMRDRVGLLEHLLAWQHSVSLNRMTRSEFDRLVRLTDHLVAPDVGPRGAEYPTRLLAIVEHTSRVAGNHEVWRHVRLMLTALLAQRIDRPWAVSTTVRERLASLRYEDRRETLPQLTAYLMTALRDDVVPAGIGS